MHHGGRVGRRKAKPQPCPLPSTLSASTPSSILRGLDQNPAPTRHHLLAFLPGSGQKVEVIENKRLNPVYPGLELHVTVAQIRAEFRTESHAQRERECRSRDAAEQSKIPLAIRNEKELS